MKSTTLALIIFLMPLTTWAAPKKLKYIQTAVNHATPQEKQDLKKMLDQIEVIPIKAKYKGQKVFKVHFVEKNSPFDRAGFKRGDLVLTGNPPSKNQ